MLAYSIEDHDIDATESCRDIDMSGFRSIIDGALGIMGPPEEGPRRS